MNRPILLAAAALALAACTPDFDPASKVEKLRVLAVRAEPPEIEPASASADAPDRAALTSFVVRADEAADPTRETTVLYLACVPRPGDLAPSPCVALAGLRDPTSFLAAAARASCGGSGMAPVAFAGVEACAPALRTSPGSRTCRDPVTAGGITFPSPAVVVPAGYAFPAEGPERILGVEAVVIAFAIDATPDELAAGAGGTPCPLGAVADRLAALWAAREHVLATKRVWIRGPDALDAPNVNPAIEDVASAAVPGTPLPPTLAPGTIVLQPLLPPGADALHQEYTELDARGVPIESRREEWIASWFSTAGELDLLHVDEGDAQEWRLPAGSGPALLVSVVRDLRGGVAWAARELAVAAP